MTVIGNAELSPYVFTRSIQRSCFFRCPCDESIPWQYVQWGSRSWKKTPPTLKYKIKNKARWMHWEKRCRILPPRAYDLSSNIFPWPKTQTVDIVCAKKHYDFMD